MAAGLRRARTAAGFKRTSPGQAKPGEIHAIRLAREDAGTAYDILVRPARARTAVENETGTVQPDFLSGIYGGITMKQW
jgi:putative ABC transport system permease protein